jgi:C_GCAxxG_C_C family probable redox protein
MAGPQIGCVSSKDAKTDATLTPNKQRVIHMKKNDTKKVFWQCGACSHTLFHLLNREFGHLNENQERASDLFAGGIVRAGHQCGMLWGAALAVGAESFRRHNDRGSAIAVAISATQNLVESFSKRAKSVNCRDITGCDMTNVLSMTKFMVNIILHGFVNSQCFNLAEQWVPEAIQSAQEGLSSAHSDAPQISCAAEVARKMGAGDEEMVTVAGFAGGIGLSGNGCGALSAAIWMKTLAWCKEHPGKTPPFFNNPDANRILKTFREATNAKMRCHEICGRQFKTIDEHTAFIKNGGCAKLITILAQS